MTSSGPTDTPDTFSHHHTERPRVRAVRRFAAFTGAVVMTPYLLIKVSWVLGAAVGWLPIGRGFSLLGWLGLNTMTVVMAAVGIALALALADTPRVRAPAVAILSFAWIGTGFLVPMLPYLVLSSALSSQAAAPAQTQAQNGSTGAELPGWEGALIQVSFAGLGLALVIALPLYLLKHWPGALSGRLGDRAGALHPAARVAISAAVLVGAGQCFWAAGGRLGLVRPQARDLDWYLQNGNAAGWALLGAGCVWLLARRRPSRVPLWVPMTITWAVSGFLITWSVWRLPFIVFLAVHGFPDGVVWPQHLLVETVICLLSILAGAGMLLTALRTYRAHLIPPATAELPADARSRTDVRGAMRSGTMKLVGRTRAAGCSIFPHEITGSRDGEEAPRSTG